MTDKHMEDAQSSDEEQETSGTSAVEEAARARKQRLLQMKSKIHKMEMKEEDYVEPEKPTKKSHVEGVDTFRSYQPISDALPSTKDEISKIDLHAVEAEIAEQLQMAADTSHVDKIDLQTLAPKKVDWDLKRDLTKKLEKLERRTQAAIADLIRERLAAGGTDLATAVNTAAPME